MTNRNYLRRYEFGRYKVELRNNERGSWAPARRTLCYPPSYTTSDAVLPNKYPLVHTTPMFTTRPAEELAWSLGASLAICTDMPFQSTQTSV